MEDLNITEIITQLLTVLIIGGVIYSLHISMKGIGGLIGKAIKLVGVGVIILSMYILNKIFENLIDFGIFSFIKNPTIYYIMDHSFLQLSLFFLAWGLICLAKMVKSINKN